MRKSASPRVTRSSSTTDSWFAPLREAFDAFVTRLAENVTGTVTIKLYKGNATVVGRKSPYSLYSQDLASFDMTGYDVKDSAGFIKLFGLQLRGSKRISPMGVKKEVAQQ